MWDINQKQTKKDNFIKVILIVVALVVAFLMTFQLSKRATAPGEQTISVRFGTQIITGYRQVSEENEEQIYLFIPSFIKSEDIKLGRLSASFYDEKKNRYHGGSSLKKLPLNTPISCTYEKTNKPFVLTILKSDNMNTIFIQTSSLSMDYVHASQENEESARMLVFDSDGNVNYDGALNTIKGRGNYTWSNWEKKSYTIGLQRADNVLNLGHGEKYALFANASDATLIRNELGRQMDMAIGMPYAKAGVYADLYLNGEYAGNYYLCGTLSIGPEQIPIKDMDGIMKQFYQGTRVEAYDDVETADWKAKDLPTIPEDITGGYLLEREFIDRYKLEYKEYMGSFQTQNDECFIVKSPRFCSKEQIFFLKELFDSAEEDILRDGISGLINPDTFAQRIVVEEFVKNYDAGVSSAYFYKDSDLIDGRICAGPGWDYDMSLGNYLDWMEYAEEGPEGVTKLHISGYASDWYERMYDNPKMFDLMKHYYEEALNPYLDELIDSGIKNYQEQLAASAKMDAIRWSEMYKEKGYFAGNPEEYKQLKTFIKERKDFLDDYFMKDKR